MRISAWLVFLVLLYSLTANAFADQARLVIDAGGHTAKISDVIFTHDGQYLVSAGYDKVVRVWNVQTGKTERTIRGEIGDGQVGQIYTMALSPDDQYLAIGGWLPGYQQGLNPVRIHAFSDGQVLHLFQGHQNMVFDLAFSSDGRLASASADKTVAIWKMGKREPLHRLQGHESFVYAVDFSSDGKRVISGGEDSTLRLWDAERGELIRVMEGHQDAVLSVAFSPDGRYIASGGIDKTVRLWDAKTGEFIKILGQQDSSVTSLSFSPDASQVLTGAGWNGGYTCTLFSIPSGEIVTRSKKYDNVVLATAISPDGKVAATGGGDNKEIFLWETGTGQIIRTLAGRGRIVWSVGFARDGQSIAYGNEFDHTFPGPYLGPLQKVILLNLNGEDEITLNGEVEDASAYIRALHQQGNYELKTREGTYGYQSILQIIQAGKILHEIERGPTSGYRHRSYTLTHNARYIASGGSNGVLTLYNTETGKPIREFVGHTSDVFAVAVSLDDRTLISGSADQTIRLWDLESGKNLLAFFIGSDGEWVAWTPHGYYTSSLHGDQYFGWHLNQGVDQAAKYYSARRFQKELYRPDVVAEYLKNRDIQIALEQAGQKRDQEYGPPVAITNILPPEVYITYPEQEKSVVREESVLVKALAISHNPHLPITNVRILLNGVQIAGKPEGKAKGGNPLTRFIELEIPLEREENILEIIASHEKASSKPKTRKIIYRGEERKLRPDLILLAIGISEYQDETLRLDFAAKDARTVAELFKRQEGILFEQVKAKVLVNEEATRSAIIKGLNWLEAEATQKDIRILFVSGHGVVDYKDDYYFLPVDHPPGEEPNVYGLGRHRLYDRLRNIPGKAILMVDTCRAAAVADERRKGLVNFTRVLKEINSEYTGLVTFAASTGREVSVEREEWGHGAFTRALIDGLSGSADGHGGEKDGYIYIHELGTWIMERVKELTEGQQHAIFDTHPNLPSFPFFAVAEQAEPGWMRK